MGKRLYSNGQGIACSTVREPLEIENIDDVLNLTRSYSDVLIRLHLRVAFAFGHCTMVSGTMLAGLGPTGFHA